MSAPEEWSFRCTACGRCCNSAPEMTVPELFYHQHRFVGRLAIRRIPRPADGDGRTPPPAVLLATQAAGDGWRDRCPALGSDGRCLVHDDQKPSACAVVPLDALLPDELQGALLSERARDAGFRGADCISSVPRPGFTPLVRHLTVVDPVATAALERRRQALSLEKQFWGTAVYRLLEPELFARPEALANIPSDGFMTVSIAPVISVLADISPRCRERCIEYLDAQLALCRGPIFARVARVHRTLRDALVHAKPCQVGDARAAFAAEKWLGLERAA